MNNEEEYRAYILSRKSSFKRNYYKESLKEMEKIKAEGRKPKLLLHACCVVCACWPLDFLHETFDVTVMYNNSNIYPSSEYDLRLSELKRYLRERWHDEIPLIEVPYDNESYTRKLEPMKDDPEGWKRCFFCYTERMRECFAYAEEHGFDYFTTVMTFSRQKDSQKLNEIGLNLEKEFSHAKYFVSDFKKADGAKRSKEICDAYDLYRQNYCGCVYSWLEMKKRMNETDSGSN